MFLTTFKQPFNGLFLNFIAFLNLFLTPKIFSEIKQAYVIKYNHILFYT